MKVAICQHLTASYWGGGEKEMFELATGLEQLGHEVDVHAIPYTLEKKRKVDSKRIYNGAVRYHEGLVHLIKADVVYLMYHPFARLNFITTAPTVASFQSQIWFNSHRGQYGIVPRTAAMMSDLLIQREVRRYDALHAHYPFIAREIESRAPLHPPVYTIEHFLDTEVFKPNGGKRGDKFRVLYAGRPVWQKGFDLFVRLAHELSGDSIEFLFVGGTVDDKKVKSIGLLQDQRQMARVLDAVNLVVSPQRIEISPGRSVIESLSCGTPVVVMTRYVDPPLADCESLFMSGDYRELKNVVLDRFSRWRSGAYDQERLSVAARQCILKNYSLQVTLRRYERMLAEVSS